MGRSAGALSFVPGVVFIALLIGAAVWLFPRAPSDPSDYAAIARGLQVEAPALGPDEAWREGPPADPSTPGWLSWLESAANLIVGLFVAVGRIIGRIFESWMGWAAVALVILSGLGYLVWKYGRVSGPGQAPRSRSRSGRAREQVRAAAAEPGLTFEAVLAMDDLSRALGALLSLALSAAARLAQVRLTRSDTAREVLRRLPRDFEFFNALRTLVAEAERVRFAGAEISAEQFMALAESVRSLVERAASLDVEPA
ncbi:MAG: hypothetical protein NXI12_09585 [Alphaproteobacteria bacterium]|nr:hypothetical protein [Alphaproteobacteria bacterium]